MTAVVVGAAFLALAGLMVWRMLNDTGSSGPAESMR